MAEGYGCILQNSFCFWASTCKSSKNIYFHPHWWSLHHSNNLYKIAHWSLTYSLQLPCWGWGWHNGNHNNGPGFCSSRKTNPKTFTALWGLWESWDASYQSDGPFRTPTAPSERPQPTGEDDQPASVSTESPAQVFVETPLCMALPWTCWRSQA